MPVRSFASNGAILASIGAWSGVVPDNFTIAAIVKRNSTAANPFFEIATSAATPTGNAFTDRMYTGFELSTDVSFPNGPSYRYNGTDRRMVAPTAVNADGWRLRAITRPSAGAHTVHEYDLTGGTGLISRTLFGTTYPNLAALSATDLFGFGKNEFSQRFGSLMAVLGFWHVEMTNTQADELYTNLNVASWLLHSAGVPLALWEFNQPNVGIAVTDATGGGANQTAISGTTVVVNDEPPGLTFLPSGMAESPRRMPLGV